MTELIIIGLTIFCVFILVLFYCMARIAHNADEKSRDILMGLTELYKERYNEPTGTENRRN